MNWRSLYIIGFSICFGGWLQAGTELNRELPQFTNTRLEVADAALADTFIFQGVRGSPRIKHSSKYDWQHGGPKDDKEWAWFLNRHRYFEELYLAYSATGDSRYAQKLFAILEDWLDRYASPPKRISFSTAWRPLEAARRILESWDLVYVKLWQNPHFPEALKPKFLRALDSHGDYLQSHHAWHGNHLITEMLALLKLALLRPEATNSQTWKRYALDKLEQEYAAQFYQAGAHKELSAHYQRVVLLNYQLLITLLKSAQEKDLLEHSNPRVDRMWDYFAAIQKPNGFAPLNNDSDLENIRHLTQIHRGAPAPLPTTFSYFKQAGHVIFRQLSENSHPLWAFFDIGPGGIDHQHEDHLHLSLSYGDFDVVVDNGRYTYKPGPWRDYFQGPRGHNVLMVDGQASDPKPNEAEGPLDGSGYIQAKDFEAAWGESSFRGSMGAPQANWQRVVVRLPEGVLMVLDHLITFSPKKIDGFWHGSPGTVWTLNNQTVQINTAERTATLSFATSREVPLQAKLSIGQEQPSIAGWHSKRFNVKTPSYAMHYSTTITAPTMLAWLFSNSSKAIQIEAFSQHGENFDICYRTANKSSYRLTGKLPIAKQSTTMNLHRADFKQAPE